MKTIMKVGIGLAIVATAIVVVPALRGPYNRLRNTANEKLDAEYVVDNYKAEYIKLHDKKAKISENLQKFRVEQAVVDKKLTYAIEKENLTKNELLAVGTSDLNKFNRAKDIYEAAKIEVSNFNTMRDSYANAIAKLENSLYLIDCNMRKAKANVTALESKKILVDSIKGVNAIVENINGVGQEDSSLAINIEKLDDDVLRESIKLEALKDEVTPTLNKEDAEAYLKSL